MNPSDREYDDLTAISGIKEKRQQLLRQSLNIRTYQDLANLSVDEIEFAFRAEGQIVSRDAIQRWLAEARKFAAAGLASQRAVESAHTETGAEANSPAAEGEWEWLKAFVVEFCVFRVEDRVKEQEIRAYPLKISKKGDWLDNGETKKTPVVIKKGKRLYSWMVEQLGEQVWSEPEEEHITEAPRIEVPPVEAPLTEAPLAVEVTQIRAFQPPNIETPAGLAEAGQPFVGLIMGHKPFALEVAFVLPELPTADIVRRKTTYRANFYVRSMATGVSTSLGDTKSNILTTGKVSYTARLPEVTLQPGRYRLGVQVKLRSRPPSVKHLEVPMFQVV